MLAIDVDSFTKNKQQNTRPGLQGNFHKQTAVVRVNIEIPLRDLVTLLPDSETIDSFSVL